MFDQRVGQAAVVLEPELVRELVGFLRDPEDLLVDEEVLGFAGAEVAEVFEALGQVQARELADGLEVVDGARGVCVVREVLVLREARLLLWWSAAS